MATDYEVKEMREELSQYLMLEEKEELVKRLEEYRKKYKDESKKHTWDEEPEKLAKSLGVKIVKGKNHENK